MKKSIQQKKFQLTLSLIVFSSTMIGIFMFSAVTEMHLYRMLVKQTLKDNITIGESILNFINRTPAWQQEDYQQILQETCDLIHLPNKGYICAVDSVGDLIAAPGLTPDRKATLTKASFSSLSRDSLYSFRTFFDSQNFQGYYEYPQSGYSDIISTVEVDSLNIKILVHQSNRLIRKDVREKIRIYYLFGFIMAIIMAIVTYFVIDWRVSKYQKEITKKNDELESKNKQLHAISQEKDVLSSLMAHDLKSPLANITNIVDLLKEMGAINSTQNEMVEYLQQETQRGLLLIEDIMTVSRLESPEYLIEIEDCHITEEWDRFIAGHVQTAANKNINLEVDLGHKAIVLESYKQGLFRIFDNLLSNALKYTEAEKRVNVKLQVDEQQFLFSVKDEGPGIPEAELPRLFDKFTKISTVPTANESSTGLGLYTAKLLATKLGGTITVDSKLGSGTTFQLILPLK